ncbi:MAG: twin-arginine translocase subunit TatC [Canibacter sp.]
MARKKKQKNPEGRMSLGEHLVELRKRLVISAIAIVVAAVAGWFLSDLVWELLRAPVEEIAADGHRVAKISYNDVTSSFDLKLRISFFIALFIACPIWLYQIWAFFAPGLRRREKLLGIGFISAAVPLFLGGAVTAWWVLPNIVTLLTSFSSDQDAILLNARDYLSFAMKLMFAVGAGYVMPVLLVLLNFIGVFTGKTILKSWRVAVLLIALFAAITTPAADIVSMFVLLIPMTLLYFVAVGIALLHDRRVEKKREKALAEDAVV